MSNGSTSYHHRKNASQTTAMRRVLLTLAVVLFVASVRELWTSYHGKQQQDSSNATAIATTTTTHAKASNKNDDNGSNNKNNSIRGPKKKNIATVPPQQQLPSSPEVDESSSSSSSPLLDADSLSSSVPNEEEQKKSPPPPPYFIIHVGPSKTATTTVQKDMGKLLVDALEADDYVYLSRYRTRHYDSVVQSTMRYSDDANECHGKDVLTTEQNHENEDGNGGEQDDDEENQTDQDHERQLQSDIDPNDTSFVVQDAVPCWNTFIAEMKEWSNKGKSVIFSEETVSNKSGTPFRRPEFFRRFIVALRDELESGDYFRFRVVVGYRRYAEWSVSAVKQMEGRSCASSESVKNNAWELGPCTPVWELVRDWMPKNAASPATAYRYYFTNEVVDKWRGYGFPVSIFNLHRPGDLTEQFVCDMLPNASRACEAARQKALEQPPTRANSRSEAVGAFGTLVYEAFQRGMIPRNKERHSVLNEMENYLAEKLGSTSPLTFAELPLKNCPGDEEVQPLLDASLRLEKEIVPDWHAISEAEHCESFWNMVHGKKTFCAVDVEAAFANSKTWDEVLDGLADRASLLRQEAAADEKESNQ
uniref:Sulfotransferase domain-containing protein n=1 Tax=Amphora coffeiformis TaxID=265554 RepID=A0A6S8K054_9STRA